MSKNKTKYLELLQNCFVIVICYNKEDKEKVVNSYLRKKRDIDVIVARMWSLHNEAL